MSEQSRLVDARNSAFIAVTATYKLMHRNITALLAEEGLTQPQFYALRVMARHGPTPMKTLSDELWVTAANITGIVDRLESKGLIERAASKEDRRTTIVTLTAKGRKLQEGVAKKYTKFIQKALQKLSREEQETLRGLLARLQDEMSDLDG
jgi:DNA-binding MarR family transcriptional regulator